jgi:hypothetical protein
VARDADKTVIQAAAKLVKVWEKSWRQAGFDPGQIPNGLSPEVLAMYHAVKAYEREKRDVN